MLRLLPDKFSTTLTAAITPDDVSIPIPASAELALLNALPDDNDYTYIRIKSSVNIEGVMVVNMKGKIAYKRNTYDTLRFSFPKGSCVDSQPTWSAIAAVVCEYNCCAGKCADEDPCNINKITGLIPNIGSSLVPCGEAMNSACDIPMKDGCILGYYPNECGFPVKAVHINAIVSEILNFIKSLGGVYDCSRLDNIGVSFAEYIKKMWQDINQLVQNVINAIENGDIDISNALKCVHLEEASPTESVTPVGVVKNGDNCYQMKRITFPQTVANRIFITSPTPQPLELHIPNDVSMVCVQLQAAGGAGGTYDVADRAAPGGDSYILANGQKILLAEGGESGMGGMDDNFPITASGGMGKVLDENFIYDKYVWNIPAGSGKRDWLESTWKKAGGIGDGGDPIGPYGRRGNQTGCFTKDENGGLVTCNLSQEQIQRNWYTLCGYMGGGAGGGNVTGCQWGSGGGAGGYLEVILQLTGKNGQRINKLEVFIGAGSEALGGASPRNRGGDGYCLITW